MMSHASRRLLALLCAALLLSSFPAAACADTGPKPAVDVYFENAGDEPCYGTLLSESKGNGPWVAWNGTNNEEYARDEAETAWSGRAPYEVWKAFVEYRDADGFYFLQFAQRIDESETLSWSYYPPDTFKILLYYPQTGRFAVSGIVHRTEFHARFQVDLQNGSTEQLKVERLFSLSRELPSFLFRLALTLAVELGIALLFSLRGRKPLLCIAAVNIATQLLLNLLLSLWVGRGLSPGLAFWTVALYLPGLELGVVILESLAYGLLLNKYTDRRHKAGFYIVYALVANAASFGLGLALSAFLPSLF